jgi:hypothetical protein
MSDDTVRERLEAVWLPMNSAPRDGSVITGRNYDRWGWGVEYSLHWEAGEWHLERGQMGLTFRTHIPDPTHWRPAIPHEGKGSGLLLLAEY